jgi:hypothetical protein
MTRFPAIAATLVLAAVAGCDASAEVSVGGKSIDRESTEETISAGLGDQANLPDPEVDCDGIEDVEVKAGEEFTCIGTAPNGERFPIEITLSDDDGGYRYQVPPAGGSGSQPDSRGA